MAPQERRANASNNNKSVDDSLPRRPQTWLWDNISDATESPASMSPAFSHQSSPAASQTLNQAPVQQQQQQQQPFISSQQLGASQLLPDLMPIMFPSGDQLAYPAQPLSTLEDGHFKDEVTPSPMQYTQEPLTQGSTSSLNGNFTQNTTPNGFDGFSGIQGLPVRSATTLAPHLQRLGLQTQIHSPATLGSSTPDTIQSPDLVSLPHNYMWQSFSLSNQNNPYEQPVKEQSVAGEKSMMTDDPGLDAMPSMGMGFDMDVNFGEILGNIGTNPNNPATMNDDWSQWMNNGV